MLCEFTHRDGKKFALPSVRIAGITATTDGACLTLVLSTANGAIVDHSVNNMSALLVQESYADAVNIWMCGLDATNHCVTAIYGVSVERFQSERCAVREMAPSSEHDDAN